MNSLVKHVRKNYQQSGFKKIENQLQFNCIHKYKEL